MSGAYNRDVREIWFRKCATFEEEAEADREYWAQFSADEKVALIGNLKHRWAMMSNASDRPNDDQVDFVRCLNRHQARALIVGAHAIAFHAKPRFTEDFDVFVEASPENAKRVLAALSDFGFGSLNITEADLAKPGQVVQLGFPPNRIDIITRISGVTFEEAWQTRVQGTFGDEPVSFIGKTELIRNKKAAGRAKDLIDLDLLRDF